MRVLEIADGVELCTLACNLTKCLHKCKRRLATELNGQAFDSGINFQSALPQKMEILPRRTPAVESHTLTSLRAKRD